MHWTEYFDSVENVVYCRKCNWEFEVRIMKGNAGREAAKIHYSESHTLLGRIRNGISRLN